MAAAPNRSKLLLIELSLSVNLVCILFLLVFITFPPDSDPSVVVVAVHELLNCRRRLQSVRFIAQLSQDSKAITSIEVR